MSINLLEETLGIVQRQKKVLQNKLKKECDEQIKIELKNQIKMLEDEEQHCLDVIGIE